MESGVVQERMKGMIWVMGVVLWVWLLLSGVKLGWELGWFDVSSVESVEWVRVPVESLAVKGKVSVALLGEGEISERLPLLLKGMSPRERKVNFVHTVIPSIVHALEKVIRTREFLLELEEEEVDVGGEEKRRIEGLCRTYRVKAKNCGVPRLLEHVDVLPIGLVLGQAAVESGWGVSRFAQEGNSLFGQWTVAQYQGLVPLNRERGKTHKVRQFETLEASVDSYLRNVNSHPVYKGLREERVRYRRGGGEKNGFLPSGSVWNLLPYLEAYSERGQEYLELLGEVIRGNRFMDLDEKIVMERGK